MDKIPILLYHNLCSETDKSADNFSVTFSRFKEQMDYLHENGFVGVSLEKMMAEREKTKMEDRKGKMENPVDTRKKVVLTFDDGDLSNYYYAFPTLKDKGFTATFFVTINEIGKKNKMDWTMIYDLARAGMDVGSHGLSHSFLTLHNNYTVLNELLTSKQVLEKYTTKRVDFLSIPQGFYNKRILTIARDIGFKAACVSDAGFNDFSKEDLFLLKRFTVRRHYSLRVVKAIADGRPGPVVAVSEFLRTRLRKMLGPRVYERLRRLRYRRLKIED